MNIPCDNEPEQDLEPLHYKDSAFDYLDPIDGDDVDRENHFHEEDRFVDCDYQEYRHENYDYHF